jgi:hypothetical protein
MKNEKEILWEVWSGPKKNILEAVFEIKEHADGYVKELTSIGIIAVVKRVDKTENKQ